MTKMFVGMIIYELTHRVGAIRRHVGRRARLDVRAFYYHLLSKKLTHLICHRIDGAATFVGGFHLDIDRISH